MRGIPLEKLATRALRAALRDITKDSEVIPNVLMPPAKYCAKVGGIDFYQARLRLLPDGCLM
jgi:hypothetical protein